MKFRVLPEAQAELLEAADWYDRRRAHLGDELLAEVHEAFATIRSNATSLPQLEFYRGNLALRRLLLKRFPYVVTVLCRSDEVLGRS